MASKSSHINFELSNVILDTNIIQYSSNKFFGNKISGLLEQLQDKKLILNISAITGFESLNTLNVKEIPETVKYLDKFRIIHIDTSIIFLATVLSNIYKEFGADNNISNEDKLIAATAILNKSYILTSNINDFPRPVFKSIHEEKIFYKNKKGAQCLQICQLLQADTKVISGKMEELGYK